MLAAAPWRAAASSNVSKLPALQAAASTPSARGRVHVMGITGSRFSVLAPHFQGTLHVQDVAARTERGGGAALKDSSSILMPLHARAKQRYPVSLSCAAAGSLGAGVQLAVPGRHAPTSSLGTPARTAQLLASMAGKIPMAWSDTGAASTPRSPSGKKGSEGQACRGKEQNKVTLPASVPEDAEISASSKAACSPEEASDAPFFLAACEGEENKSAASTMPESSRQALGEAPRLQDPREITKLAYGYSPMIPAVHRICGEETKDRM